MQPLITRRLRSCISDSQNKLKHFDAQNRKDVNLFNLTSGLTAGCRGGGGCQIDPPLYFLIVIQIYNI